MLIISYSANQISQTGKGEFETLYKTVDKYLKFDKQQKGSLKHYTKPLINISNLTNRKGGGWKHYTKPLIIISQTGKES